MHLAPSVHESQVAPPKPQLAADVPSWHSLFRQQPSQFSGEQPCWHVPSVQVIPVPQEVQAFPAVPQASRASPATHMSPWQQPAQFWLLQAELAGPGPPHAVRRSVARRTAKATRKGVAHGCMEIPPESRVVGPRVAPRCSGGCESCAVVRVDSSRSGVGPGAPGGRGPQHLMLTGLKF